MSDAVGEPMQAYLDRLASNSPTPGGGSVAALVGALGAALGSMVANFTVGKEKFAAVEDQVRRLLAGCEAARAELSALVQADMDQYAKVSAAYGMPRGTEEEKAARRAAIQQALKDAAGVPLEAVAACHRVLALNRELVEVGNPNLISDVGVAVALALAALDCAALNVEINLAFIKDEGFNAQARAQMAPLLAEAPAIKDEVWGKVERAVKK